MDPKKPASNVKPMADMAAEANRILIEGLPDQTKATIAMLRQKGFARDQIQRLYTEEFRRQHGDQPSFFLLSVDAYLEQTEKAAGGEQPK